MKDLKSYFNFVVNSSQTLRTFQTLADHDSNKWYSNISKYLECNLILLMILGKGFFMMDSSLIVILCMWKGQETTQEWLNQCFTLSFNNKLRSLPIDNFS